MSDPVKATIVDEAPGSDLDARRFASGDDFEGAEPDYRPLSGAAVLCLIFGILATLSIVFADGEDVSPFSFVVLPALGALCGLRAIGSIRRYEMKGLGLAKGGLALSGVGLAASLAIVGYIRLTEVPKGCLPITYEQLQPQKEGEVLPPSAKGLDGKKVFIKGYVYPSRQMTGIKKFVLCRDNKTCCFGGQPKLNDMIEVTLKEPLTFNYDQNLHHLAGVFRVQPGPSSQGLGGVLYHLEADFLR